MRYTRFPIVERLAFGLVTILAWNAGKVRAQEPGNAAVVTRMPGLVAFWTFGEEAGQPRKSIGTKDDHPLAEAGGPIPRVVGGPFSGYAAELNGKQYFRVPYAETGELNIAGPAAQVSMFAAVRIVNLKQSRTIAGMWSEGKGANDDSGTRQYALLMNMPTYGGPNKLVPHISSEGGVTRRTDGSAFPWCADYAVTAHEVPTEKWCSLGFTYDGKYIRAYLNGVLDGLKLDAVKHKRTDRYFTQEGPGGSDRGMNPYYHGRGIFRYDAERHAASKPGGGSDFTVGARYAVGEMLGEATIGRFGGLAVFNRSLSDGEMLQLHQAAAVEQLNQEAAAAKPRVEKPVDPAQAASNFLLPSDDEPKLEMLSLTKAAQSLDRVSLAWVQKHKCGSCHTGWPYLMARGALPDEPSKALAEIRQFFERRITNWDEDEKTTKHWHREIVGTSTALALHDAQTTGKLAPITREALDRMWTMQRSDGAWNWPKCSWPPFEIDDYYGAVLAAVGVGHAPDDYARGDSAQAGVAKLRAYFAKIPPPSVHHQTWLLWASQKLDGILTAEEQQATIKALIALQRSDGGWSMESLGKDWEGRKGESANPDAPSDGYGTGLVIYVLRRSGLPTEHESIQRGKSWLASNQRVSGRWFTRSLNGVKQHYISDTASAFAVLALRACE